MWEVKTFDSFVLRQYQAVSDFIQKWIGIDNFGLARFSLLGGFIFCMVTTMYMIQHAREFHYVATGVLVGLVVHTIGYAIIEDTESTYHRTVSSLAVRNEIEVTWYPIRLFMGSILSVFVLLAFGFFGKPQDDGLVTAEVFQVVWYFLCMIAFAGFCCIYFVSCTPEPPSRGKLFEFMNSILGKLTASP